MPDRQNPKADTATVEADLAAIEAALGAGRATSADERERAFQELALALEADAPRARAEFERELGERMRAGFPRQTHLPGLRSSVSGATGRIGRLFAPGRVRVAAGAVTALIAVAVAVSLQVEGGSDDPSPLDADDRALERAPGAESSAGDAAPSTALPPPQPPPADGDFAPGARRRQVERSASIALLADRERLDGVADGISTVAGRHGGFVLRSSLSTGESGTDGGSFELKVPVRNLPATLQDLDELAEVTARTQSSEDVTAAAVSLRDELDAARAKRRSLLRRLERADSDRAAEALRRRIELASARVNGLRGRVRALRERTAFASVDVSITARDGDSDGGGAGRGGIEDAAADALGSLLGAVNLLLRALGVVIPLALAGGLAWLAARALRRRRREAALS